MVFGDGYSTLFQAAVLSFVAGALLPLAFRDGRKSAILSFAPPALGSVLIVALSASVAISGLPLDISPLFAAPVPALSIEFHVDGVAAFFMLIIGPVAFAASIYSIGYVGEYSEKRSKRALGFLFNLFVLSMFLVTASDSAFSFLVFWEAMSLASFFLVIYEHDNEGNIKAGMTYIVMTHLGTAFITGSFLAMYFHTGSLSFDSFRDPASPMPPYIKDVAFVLAFIGFGTKAGLVPMHVWLPQAHPSAPSNVSALMSAVMVKVAIYGLVRTTLDFAVPGSPDSAWWGMLMVVAGSVSALIGVLYAAIEKDIKRALAYSTIENIGIVVLGLGLSVTFASFGLQALAAVALLAAMYHSLNHAAFKSLLFMGAGSILFRTHTKDMEQLGGLAKKMPQTALLFLVGAIAISGLPPLNGFVSEWLTMQALLSSYQVPNTALQISISFASIAFALTAGIALATFVKMFGITFLSRPRSEAAAHAKEAPKTMIAGMGIAAALCVVFGVLPFVATGMMAASFELDPQQFSVSPFDALAVPYRAGEALSNLSMPAIAIMMGAVAAAIIGFAFAAGSRSTKRRLYGTWDCGFGALDARMQYTAGSLSQPIRTVFRALYRPRMSVTKDRHSASNPYAVKSARVESETRDVFEEGLYSHTVSATVAFFDKVRRIQTGKVNAYLLYVMIALALLLLLARLVP
uniref:Hydrogenase 4, membrane subunit n=1 Tax=Nitrososphaera viennensis EN76 TaxID=926571 RepID=A0A060HE50_9ARCH|nr:hydrogenase 4, membrane subunit [Nitrososphaera viennensis EN76]